MLYLVILSIAVISVFVGMVFHLKRQLKIVNEQLKNTSEGHKLLTDFEKDFRTVIDNAWDMIALFTVGEYKCVYVNQVTEKITQYTLEEFKQLKIEDVLVNTPENNQLISVLKEKRKTDKTSRFEFEAQMRTKAGTILDCLFHSFPVVVNNTCYIAIFCKDVTQYNKAIKEKAAIIESCPNAIIVCNEAGTITYSSPQTAVLFDCNIGQLNNYSFFDLFHQSERENATRLLSDCFSGNNVTQNDYKFMSFTGEPFFGRINIAIMNCNIQCQNSLVINIQDITFSKMNLEALQKSEERFRLLFNSIEDAVFVNQVIVNQIKLVEVNNAAEKMYGYSKAELFSISGEGLIKDYSPEFENRLKTELFQTGKIAYEAEHVKKNGEVFPVEVRGKLFDYNGKLMFFCTVRDITERKRTENEIRLLYHAISQSDNAVFIRDKDSKLVYINAAFERLLGYSFAELKELSSFLPSESFRNPSLRFIKKLFRIPKRGIQIISQIKGVNRYGIYFWANTITTPVKSENGEITSYITILNDITSIKEMAEEKEKLILELQKTNKELSELSKMKDDFLVIASHDLRAPFSNIIGFAEILLSDNSLNEAHRNSIELILESANIQFTYINDLLDILNFESGNIHLYLEQVDLNEILRKVAEQFRVLANKKMIGILQFSDVHGSVYMDTAKIVQVLNNLVYNAIKFTHKSGQIRIESFKNAEGLIEIHVIDNGVGIPEKNIESIFDRYKTVHTAGTDNEKGTGFGLPICKKLVELHGGRIDVKSVFGKGSDFYFTLPSKPKMNKNNE